MKFSVLHSLGHDGNTGRSDAGRSSADRSRTDRNAIRSRTEKTAGDVPKPDTPDRRTVSRSSVSRSDVSRSSVSSDMIASTVRQVTDADPDVAREAQELAERFRLNKPRITKHPDLPPVIHQIIVEAQERMNTEMRWYHDLTPDDKNQLNIVAETAVANFVDWYRESKDAIERASAVTPELPRPRTDEIFFVAPLEFTKSISLNQVVELTRFIVDSTEANVSRFAEPGMEQATLNAMMYYSREVAFSAANVYASSAQARGDWDARLEALTIADLLDGTASHQVASRLNLLGWHGEFACFAVAGVLSHTGDISLSLAHRHVRQAVRTLGGECLVSEHDDLTVLLIDPRRGDHSDHNDHSMEPDDFVQALLPLFDSSPVCVGPLKENLPGASYTIRAAVHSRQAAKCLANVPRPLRADDVLPERALLGDDDARRELYENVYKVLRGDDDHNPLLLTLSTFLRSGNALDVTARELNVHPNTVRYRLKRSVEVTGWDPMNPREAYVLLTAIKIGLMLDD
ncbi:PucR C-terminal helix-turn-helix domain-containing protein [Bifidobacterium margollesii]|uniref:PucR C-terminal helix-turn-helix domain-containing protein n=1 Tax=Bifidobacterium margollesii TaxID=2020964 RepID=A0A2N5JCL2_9BIFI|nr:PucR family transcriptional regulator [Bifidobacterium margollesii]PLS31950.1 PucR C-terminal helix-turn-helix domain-containing protein [Bifidobacterium margollesii]